MQSLYRSVTFKPFATAGYKRENFSNDLSAPVNIGSKNIPDYASNGTLNVDGSGRKVHQMKDMQVYSENINFLTNELEVAEIEKRIPSI